MEDLKTELETDLERIRETIPVSYPNLLEDKQGWYSVVSIFGNTLTS